MTKEISTDLISSTTSENEHNESTRKTLSKSTVLVLRLAVEVEEEANYEVNPGKSRNGQRRFL